MLEYAAITDLGICQKNDDRIMIDGSILSFGKTSGKVDGCILAVVCDGVGGYSYGDEAAECTVKVFANLVGQQINQAAIEQAIADANSVVIAAQSSDNSHRNMSSTLAGIYLYDNSFLAFNIGDSKIFRLRNSYLSQLSVDHTYAQESVDLGLVRNKMDIAQKDRHRITRCIGDKSNCKPSITSGEGRLFEDDIFLVCSDGVTDVVDNDLIETILSEQVGLQMRCEHLFQQTLQNGSQDNISIILLEVL